MTLRGWPASRLTSLLAFAVYGNFFAKRWLGDARWVLIGFFLWVAENVATFFGAWQYPNQHAGWHPVGLAKMSSWSLRVIFSFLIVAQLKHVKETRQGPGNPPEPAADRPGAQ